MKEYTETDLDETELEIISSEDETLSETKVNFLEPESLEALYLRDISPIPLLSRDEELELAYQVKEAENINQRIALLEKKVGRKMDPLEISEALEISIKEIHQIRRKSKEATRKLVVSNLRLVVSIAKKYRNRGLPLIDLIQDGNLGLITAVEKFEPSKGFRFSTYATWWIKQSISRGLASKGRLIRLPNHVFEATNKLKKTIGKMLSSGYEKIDDKDLANTLQISPEKLANLSQVNLEPFSLDSRVTINGDDNDDVAMSALISSGLNNPEEILLQKSLSESVRKVLETLDEKEQIMINMRFGLEDGNQHSLQDIASYFNLTRAKVKNMLAKAMKKLKSPERVKTLVNY